MGWLDYQKTKKGVYGLVKKLRFGESFFFCVSKETLMQSLGKEEFLKMLLYGDCEKRNFFRYLVAKKLFSKIE